MIYYKVAHPSQLATDKERKRNKKCPHKMSGHESRAPDYDEDPTETGCFMPLISENTESGWKRNNIEPEKDASKYSIR
jgi:hypothetical protein